MAGHLAQEHVDKELEAENVNLITFVVAVTSMQTVK